MKRPVRLAWLKGGELADGKHIAHLQPANPGPCYDLSELGLVASSRPSNMIPARFHFWPTYGP